MLLIQFGVLSVLILLSAFFSASETALTTLSKAKVKLLLEQKKPGAQSVGAMIRNPGKMMAAILVGNNLVNVLASVLATIIMVEILEQFGWQKHLAIGSGVTAGAMTILLLTFGEVTPKTIALTHKGTIALFSAPIIRVWCWLITPLLTVLISFPELLMRLLKISYGRRGQLITEQELRAMITASREEGVIAEEENKMLHKVFEFYDTPIRNVMTPRNKVFALEVSSTLEQVLRAFAKNPFSRLPVYDKKLDNIVGVLFARDLLLSISGNNPRKPQFVNLGSALRKPLFVLGSRSTDSVLKEMRQDRNHFAVVVDRAGALVGIVTMEDLVEEIFGEIEDEFERAHAPGGILDPETSPK